ncbi:polar amino acid transport system substrate-binding protein [Lysinibacillus composti]|uniref:ABC transporter substrate-binding protein n=1 Tax=Lysinibacillus composti TaxID=720633 RepID=A0A3N9UAR8_9BACI|nr:transporter substrate-binding domain-containing protein [Lysinibacillus composti]MBM7609806.1 polar amino acid transport system substrate-binding protein [Lysinibacillus composti]RQW73580.1 ABC transporter substrate-binding protein [Lysinibacillus composti]
MKKWFLHLTLVIAVFVVGGCSGGESGTGEKIETSATNSKLIMATSADYKPFEYHELSNGEDQIVGFDLDVANALSEQMGVALEIRDMDYTGLLSALQSERVNFVIAAMSPTEERKKNVDFSDAYFTTKFAALSPNEEYQSISGLKDLKVGVQLGSTQENAAKEAGLETFALNKFPELIQELNTGRIDAVLVEETVASEYIEQNPGKLKAGVIEDLPGLDVAIAFPKGSLHVEEFNKAINALRENGKLKEIEDKWFMR